MSRSAESHVQLASGGRDDLRQLFELSFSEPARDDEDLRHAVLDYVRTAKAERQDPPAKTPVVTAAPFTGPESGGP